VSDTSDKLDRLADLLGDLPDDRTEKLLAKLEATSTFRVEEVAALLDVSERTVRRRLRDGALPGVKVEGRWRISRADLEQWYREEGGGALFEGKED